MSHDLQSRTRRKVRIATTEGMLEGDLILHSTLRTLDDLNLTFPRFLMIEHPAIRSDGWCEEGQPVCVNTASILFVVELSEFHPATGNRVETNRLARAAIRVRVEGYDLHGFMHVPESGNPLTKLMQERRPFFALTSASVVGSGVELATPFVAVNRMRVLAAHEILREADEAGRETEPDPLLCVGVDHG